MEHLNLLFDTNYNQAQLIDHGYGNQEIWLDESVIKYFKQTTYWDLDDKGNYRILGHKFMFNLLTKSWEISQHTPVKKNQATPSIASALHRKTGTIEQNERHNRIICILQD